MYKVVSVGGGGELWSATRILPTRYVEWEWVEASVGGLLVFDDEDLAIDFACKLFHDLPTQVWECDVEGEVKLPAFRVCSRDVGDLPELVRRLWEQGLGWFVGADYWPRGTRAFKRVRLVRRIK